MRRYEHYHGFDRGWFYADDLSVFIDRPDIPPHAVWQRQVLTAKHTEPVTRVFPKTRSVP